MLDDNKKRSIGRPKLANKKLKKNSIIICAICLIGIIVLLIVGAYQLNIIKLKGDSSDKLDVGEPFCLGTECFYTLDDDGKYITALSKYNLLIGYVVNVNNDNGQNKTELEEITSDTEGYGMQSSLAKALDNDSMPWIGVVKYADSVYWEENGKLLPTYGNSYPAYVANGSDNISSILDIYKDKLEEYGYNDFSLRLPSYEDMMDLGCYHIEEEGGGRCDDVPPWVTTSTYWLGSATGDKAWWVSSYINFFGYEGYDKIDSDVMLGGIRPVIKIKKTEILKKYINYRYGKEVCIEEECFNIIDSNDETVTMLAKYNLLVGNNAELKDDDFKNITPINESEHGYGLQNKEALGYVSGSSVAKGVVSFADKIKVDSENEDDYTYFWLDKDNDDYVVKDMYKKKGKYESADVDYIGLYGPNSNIYSYIEAYRKKLIDLSGYNSITARAIDFQDYVSLLCRDIDCNNGISIPKWYNPTTAWTGMSFDPNEVIILISDSGLTEIEPNTFYAGVRPVITVDITDLEKNDKKEEKATKYEDIKTANRTTLDTNNSAIYKAINNKEVVPEKATTTTKVKNLGNRLIATNEVCSRWIYIMLLVDGILLLIIIIELILYRKTRKETK